MGKVIDRTGQKFGMLVVIRQCGFDSHHASMWECLCECGEIVVASNNRLQSGTKINCGCVARKNKQNVIGRKFGRLTVLGYDKETRNGKCFLNCECDCGKKVNVSKYRLIIKKSVRSCGCLRTENVTKHGRSKTLEYTSWALMKQRCTNPRHHKYKDYGGRGIKIHDRWLEFKNFFADMGERPSGCSLDRIDVNGDYEPGNCRWATAKEQMNNQRRSKKNK